MNVDDLSKSLKKFKIIDQIVFGSMLGVCSVIGLYFGYQDLKRKRASKNDNEVLNFLMGGRKMKVFPVAMSLIASLVSGILLLGASTEIYLYGTQYVYIIIAIIISAVILDLIMIPVFHKLQITSVYEYLQLRFDKKMRLFGSLMYTISSILWLPIVLYVPALAFNQMTSINIHKITPIVMAVCLFYCSLGGMKAVVYTDFIQIIIMYGTLIVIAIKGTINVGGFLNVIEINLEGKRFEAPDFNLDPTTRHTFWTLVIGGAFLYIAHNALNQNMMQRYLALRTVKEARKSNLIYAIGFIVIILLCCYNGLLLYATYYNCDPLTTKLAMARDQMLPLLVMQTLNDIPGLSGFFIAGIFSASLSSISTGLNSMACVILEDFVKPFRKKKLSETMCIVITRAVVLCFGLLGIALVFVVQNLGTILQLTLSVPTACFGPLFGVFLIGFLFPWVNKRATLYSSVIGFIIMMTFVFKVQTEMALGHIKFSIKPMSTDGCDYEFNSTNLLPMTRISSSASSIYQISYLYYTAIGCIMVVILSILLTFLLGYEDSSKINQNLLAPFVRRKKEINEENNENPFTNLQ
ncbi:hypothetical protein PVAND_000587 [Polypedilum vanderplanki]|uniref:Sodium/solute symporter n=1 Tax=Polypedilum vanderplanki TaxID=319348 RepID=A0A9J6BL13_POLVA|nr:hypothetical protein PVAND_000587 [Polypedilum vanderplanki]